MIFNMNIMMKQKIERSESSKFAYFCGKEFLHVRSLKHHRIDCNNTMKMNESEDEREREEGMIQTWKLNEIDRKIWEWRQQFLSIPHWGKILQITFLLN